ncbi:hypothetical protein [Winogradskyella sp.]|uniref:hypothetical protein n=1 Tax=Winogradskyella sp. TaxID=1883156 RepID=UPI003AB90B25
MKNFILLQKKYTKGLFLFIGIVLYYSSGYTQAPIGSSQAKIETDLPTIIPPSPTVSNLMRFEEVPVDLYTGIPDISIPLYATKISKDLNLNIGLSYNPMGIRVDERSGWTGTGWTLNAESVISRTVMDVPDEIFSITSSSDYAEGDIGTFSNNFYDLCNLDFSNLTNSEYEELSEFVWETANGKQHADYQPDLFQFSFFGYSGRFIILNINGTLQPKIISSDQKVKINLNYSVPQSIYSVENDAFDLESFEIVDPNGNKFLFEEKEVTTSTSIMSGRNQIGTLVLNTVLNPPKELEYTSAWKLSQIRMPNDEVLATYHYQQVNEILSTPLNIEKNKPIFVNGNIPAPLLDNLKSENAGLMPLKYIATGNDLDIDSKKLHKIILRDDGTEIWFSKENNHPEFQSCTLTGIDVKDMNGISYKKFDLIYYTNPNGRLFLDQINDISSHSTILPYNFTYEKAQDLPSFGDEKKDIWGYYKGPQLSYYNAIDYSKKVKTGVLKSITYPTNGKKEFDFEINQIGYIGQSLVNVKNLPENQQIQTPTPFQSFSGDLNGVGMDGPLAQRLFFQVNSNTNGDITFQTIGTISNQINYSNHSISVNRVILKNGVSNPQSENDIDSEIPISNFDIQNDNIPKTEGLSLSSGWYMVKVYTAAPYLFSNPGLPNQPNHTILNVDVTVRYGEFIYNNRNLRGGGLRIKSIRFTDHNQDQTKIDYNYNVHEPVNSLLNPDPNDINKPLSSGAFEGSILMSRSYLKEMDLITPIICPPEWGTINLYNPTQYKFEVTRYLNAVSGQMTKGNYVGYKNVSVTESGNGRTDYKFTNSLDYPTYDQNWYLNSPAYFDIPKPDLEHKKGLLLEAVVYNDNGDVLKETINEYEFVEIAEYEYKYSYYSGNCPYDRFYSYYQNYLNKTADIGSGCGGDSNPNYNANCGPFPDYIGLRDAKHIWGKTFLKNRKTKEYFYDSMSNQNLIETRQEFQYNLDNFQISQEDSYFTESESEAEVHLMQKYYYSIGTNLNSNTPLVISKLNNLNQINELLETQSYRNGNLLNETNKIYYEFSTDQVLVQDIKVAKGTNQNKSRIMFHDYDNYGNPLELSKTDGMVISYIYGYNNTSPIAKIENATYSEIEVAIGTLDSSYNTLLKIQSLSNDDDDRCLDNENCDEKNLRTALNGLRSALPNAMVTTYTYDPLIGVTSVTDPKGYTTYYEYDPFNRLARVKDQDGKIMSENKYHYFLEN